MAVTCKHDDGAISLFCSDCGKERQPGSLRTVKMMGFVGVAHSTSPKIASFLETGDPTVFD